MSKKIKNKKNLEKKVVTMIKKGQIKMRPKWYFVAGSLFATIGLIGSSISAMFLTNFIFFLIRKNGPGFGRIEMAIQIFPWWLPFLAILMVCLGVLLLKRYDFSYRKNFLVIILIFILSIIFSAWVIDKSGINEIWSKKGPMKRFYQEFEKGNQRPMIRKGPKNQQRYFVK
ncbi:MAG: hypothetical protein CH104c_0182 [Candidatus Woesebacteria bacterium]|jgi:hypothetical protein|nr:MAG: hypothetical protein CH104c_0182 [Candidatus Woesebacteria bacterium]